MKKTLVQLSLLCIFLLPLAASAAVCETHTSATPVALNQNTVNGPYCYQFTATNNCSISDLKADISVASATVSLSIHNDSSGIPNSSVYIQGASTATGEVYPACTNVAATDSTYTSSGTDLVSGTTYWLCADATAGNTALTCEKAAGTIVNWYRISVPTSGTTDFTYEIDGTVTAGSVAQIWSRILIFFGF